MSLLSDLMKNKDVKAAVEKAQTEGTKFSKKAKTKMKDLGNQAVATGKKLGKQAVNAGKKLTDAGKLKLEVFSLQQKVEKSELNIGELVVENGLPISKDNAEIKAEIANVNKYKASIAKKNAEIKKAMKEFNLKK